MAAHFIYVGIFWFADMAEFHFAVLEIRNDNQVSAHRRDDGSKLVDMNIPIPLFEL